jgi:hypothetical protein
MFSSNRAAQAMRQAPLVIVSCSELGRSAVLRQEVSEKQCTCLTWVAPCKTWRWRPQPGLATVHIGNFDPEQSGRCWLSPSFLRWRP